MLKKILVYSLIKSIEVRHLKYLKYIFFNNSKPDWINANKIFLDSLFFVLMKLCVLYSHLKKIEVGAKVKHLCIF
jgi:hypothetical protein